MPPDKKRAITRLRMMALESAALVEYIIHWPPAQ
jgi:hypothetical protein